MQVSLDGGRTWADAPEGVRIDIDVTTDEGEGQTMALNFTSEGLIADLVVGDEGFILDSCGIETYELKDLLF
jgi:hypothetical protein